MYAIRSYYECQRVRFYNAAALVNELILAQEQQRLPKFLATALKQNLIILDELGFIPFSTTGAQLLFQFCSTLHERVAVIVTTVITSYSIHYTKLYERSTVHCQKPAPNRQI